MFIFVAWAAACTSFDSASDAPGGGVTGASTPYAPDASVSCAEAEGGACAQPSFCCVTSLSENYCATSGCDDTNDATRVTCRDDTACGQGYVCCVRVDDFHAAATTCEKSCVQLDGGGGNGQGVFHVCGALGGAGCDGGTCGALEGEPIGGKVHPDPHLNVCL
jgi:hypothetical protein